MKVEDDELPLTGFRMPRGPSWRFPWRWVLLAVVLALAVSYTKLFVPQILDYPVVFFPGPPGSTIYVDPNHELTMQFPNSWHKQQFSHFDRGGVHRIEAHGVLLSNIAHHFEHAGESWMSPWEMNGLPSTLVAVQVGRTVGGLAISCLHDTPLPLSLDNATPGGRDSTDVNGTPIKNVYLRFSVGGLPFYSVSAWIGPQASESDLAILDEIVGSIWHEATGDPEYGREDCTNGI